ncbi:serine hydrolase, partial [Pseudomonas fluorescens]|nr:serine hydrolase [Pseudomonas fluorescens]
FGYDDTLADLWPQACTANTGPVAKSMTVRNALSMSTGHSPEQLLEPTLVSRRLPDLNTARILLATEPEGRPGIDFAYNKSGHLDAFSARCSTHRRGRRHHHHQGGSRPDRGGATHLGP